MKKLRYILFVSTVFLIVILTVMVGINAQTKIKDNLLTTAEVVQSFNKEGIQLEAANEFNAQSFILDEKQPMIYSFPQSDETLFIYEFSNIGTRKNTAAGLKEGGIEQIAGFNQLKSAGDSLMTILEAKNILLVYTVKYDAQRAKEITNPAEVEDFIKLYAPNIRGVNNITFEHLNEGVTIKYHGKGEFWEGKADLSYYQYFWKDENGKEFHESWNNVDFYLKYLGEDKELQEIICNYDGPTGYGQGVFYYYEQSFDKEGFVRLGTTGSNNLINSGSSNYIFNIKWNEGNETLVLNPIR